VGVYLHAPRPQRASQNKGDTADYSKLPDDILLNIARPAQLTLNYHKS
jgi:hypothetical protein